MCSTKGLERYSKMREEVREMSIKAKERDHELDEKMKNKVMKGY